MTLRKAIKYIVKIFKKPDKLYNLNTVNDFAW